jgi:hypothetical protein
MAFVKRNAHHDGTEKAPGTGLLAQPEIDLSLAVKA